MNEWMDGVTSATVLHSVCLLANGTVAVPSEEKMIKWDNITRDRERYKKKQEDERLFSKVRTP